jgi:FkbM family methyltransferase
MVRGSSAARPHKATVKELIRKLLPGAIKPHRIWTGPLRGRWIVTSWHDYPAAILGRTEAPLLEWLERQVSAGETWLDVGAHYGYTAMAISRLVGAAGRVMAFEPALATAGCVARAAELNRLPQLTTLALALSDPEEFGFMRLPVVRGMLDSTAAADTGGYGLLTARLDRLWPQICGVDPRIHGVKIDVQGMELPVLRGMAGILRAQQPKLIVEFHRGVDRRAIVQLLESCGYRGPGEPFLDDHSYSFHAVPYLRPQLSS